MVDPIDDAFARALKAIDDAMGLVREMQQRQPWHVDTLSRSLADPRSHQIEMTLSNTRMAIQSDADREALVAVTHACEAQGLLDANARDRLIKEFGS